MNRERKLRLVNGMIVMLCFLLVTVSTYTILVTYQCNRYQSNGPNKFNCVDFTKEAIDYFDKIGITAYQVVGISKTNSSYAHSWVGINVFGNIWNFEPQTLTFFDPKDEYKSICVNYNSVR
jgi:hypothetical protein